MTLEENIDAEFKQYTQPRGYLILKSYQDLHGMQAGLDAFLDQMKWNMETRASVIGQDAVIKEL